MSKKKKSAVLIESDSDDSDSGKDLEEVTHCSGCSSYELGLNWSTSTEVAVATEPLRSGNTDHVRCPLPLIMATINIYEIISVKTGFSKLIVSSNFNGLSTYPVYILPPSKWHLLGCCLMHRMCWLVLIKNVHKVTSFKVWTLPNSVHDTYG